MIQFFPPRVRAWARLAALVLLVLAGMGLRPEAAQASHLRAGDIQAKIDTTLPGNPRRVFFKMTLYTDNTSNVKQPTATIFFGDGTSSCKDGVQRNGFPGGELGIPGSPDTSVNIYYFEHTYPSVGSFTVSFIGENRNTGVVNMDRSDTQSFYIETTVFIDPALGRNRSVRLTAPAVDKAAVGQVFLHNPGAYDADGDSLTYELLNSRWVPAGIDGTVGGAPCTGSNAGTGNNTPVTAPCINFRFPDDPSIAPGAVQVTFGGPPTGVPGAAAIFRMDSRTGQITWNAPARVGFYNVAMVVHELRRVAGGFREIGRVVRDMQIIVTATNNLRPTLNVPADICVIAGQPVTGVVTATDGIGPGSTAQTAVSLFAYSGIIPPAVFRQTAVGPPTAQGTFTWQTDCSNVAQLPYQVVFKAQDSPTPVISTNPPLIDQKIWRITVVGPAPQNLRATPNIGTGSNPNTVTLNWNNYACANATQMYIYRKVNTSTFTPGPCDTGIPASAGYTLIKVIPLTTGVTSYTDSNADANGNVLGLDRGQTYCYRIYAGFPLPAGGASIASQEACATFPGAASRLVKVDVLTTSATAGQMQVCWTQPKLPAGGSFDGTPSYALSRGVGLAPTTFTPIATIASLADTCYTDVNLNTQDLQYTYKLEFVRTFPAGDNRAAVREASPTASSVRVSAIPNTAATQITVSWTYNVPWNNAARPAVIYRRSGMGTGAGAFIRLATAATTATGGTYTDNDATLRKGETYCYYVQTEGQYAGISYLSSLLNRSQERCLVLNSPPCTPVLALQVTNCDSLANLQSYPQANERYTNRLRWRLGSDPTGCDTSIANYRVYYRATPTGQFTFLGTTTSTSYTHPNLEFSGGCYAVQAIARTGLVSDTSNVACQDNCVFFKLPNIFTPNGDSKNAVFRPKNFSPIRRIHFTAFNRWGVKVFENTTTASDPILINWDGGGPVGESSASAGKVSDGIYYYLAEVEFADFANSKRTYKGWVEIVR